MSAAARFLLLLSFCVVSFPSFATLSPIEKQIRDTVIKQQSSQIQLLKKLVNINSGTTNPKGVHQVGELLRPLFKQLGFKTKWIEEPSTMHRAGTLLAERSGHQGSRLLLIGHLDTVFPKDSPFQQFQLKKLTAKGPGVIDDKGGLVVILYALKALHAVHALENTTITIVLTGDEEDSGKPTSISRKPLIEAAKRSDIALDFEPSVTLNTATIARRGVAKWSITTKGNESHSATIFQENVGAGAIFEMARILNTLREQLQKEKELSFNPGIILGGTKMQFYDAASQGQIFGKQNVVAKIALSQGDFRFLTPAQKLEFENKLTAMVKNSLPNTTSKVDFQDGIPAMPPTAANLELLKKYSQASEALGTGPIQPLPAGLRGAGDISHVASLVSANLAGLGPIGLGTHSVIESIELASLPVQTERTALFIYKLTR